MARLETNTFVLFPYLFLAKHYDTQCKYKDHFRKKKIKKSVF